MARAIIAARATGILYWVFLDQGLTRIARDRLWRHRIRRQGPYPANHALGGHRVR